MIAFYKQYGHTIYVIHSDHETTILSAQIFLNQQGIQLKTIAPYQQEQNLEIYVQTINTRFRSVLSSIKFKLPNQLYAQLFTIVQQMINHMPNSIHPTLTNKYTIIKAHPSDFGFQGENSFPLIYQISSTYLHVLKRAPSQIKKVPR